MLVIYKEYPRMFDKSKSA